MMLWILRSVSLFGQNVDCSNIGFEQRSTDGWIFSNENVQNVGNVIMYANETRGIYASGHVITKASDGNDPLITAAAIPMVAPGSNYSLRLGQTEQCGRFDRAKTSFIVGPENTLF